ARPGVGGVVLADELAGLVEQRAEVPLARLQGAAGGGTDTGVSLNRVGGRHDRFTPTWVWGCPDPTLILLPEFPRRQAASDEKPFAASRASGKTVRPRAAPSTPSRASRGTRRPSRGRSDGLRHLCRV